MRGLQLEGAGMVLRRARVRAAAYLGGAICAECELRLETGDAGGRIRVRMLSFVLLGKGINSLSELGTHLYLTSYGY